MFPRAPMLPAPLGMPIAGSPSASFATAVMAAMAPPAPGVVPGAAPTLSMVSSMGNGAVFGNSGGSGNSGGGSGSTTLSIGALTIHAGSVNLAPSAGGGGVGGSGVGAAVGGGVVGAGAVAGSPGAGGGAAAPAAPGTQPGPQLGPIGGTKPPWEPVDRQPTLGEVLLSKHMAGMAMSAYGSIASSVAGMTGQEISASYGMSQGSINAMYLRRNAGIVGGTAPLIGTIGGALIGSAFGAPQIGAMVGGAAGSLIGGTASTQMSLNASREEVQGQLDRLRGSAAAFGIDDRAFGDTSGKNFGWFQNWLHPGLQEDADRAQQSKLTQAQMLQQAQQMLPGTMSAGDVSTIYNLSRSAKLPEGDPFLSQQRIQAIQRARREHYELAGLDLSQMQHLPDAQRNSYRGLAGISGDFSSFTLPFGLSGLRPGDMSAMTDLFKQSQKLSNAAQIQDSIGSQQSSLFSRQESGGAGLSTLVAQLQQMTAVQGQAVQISQALIAEMRGQRGTPEGEVKFQQAVSGLEAAKAQMQALIAQETQLKVSRGQMTMQAQSGGAELALQNSMYGAPSDTLSAFGGMGRAINNEANKYEMFASLPGISPEQAALFRLQAEQARQRQKYDLPRQRGQYMVGLQESALGVQGAHMDTATWRAQTFGDPNAAYHAAMNQAGLITSQGTIEMKSLMGLNGPQTQQERLDTEKRLIDLQRQHAQALEAANVALEKSRVQIAEFATSMSSGRQQLASLSGAGGMETLGLGIETRNSALHASAEAQSRIDGLRHRGYSENSPEMMAARQEKQAQDINAAQMTANLPNQPLPYDIRSKQARNRFEIEALEGMPGTYGQVRSALQSQIGLDAKAFTELEKEIATVKASQGGKLTQGQTEAYQNRAYDLGRDQLSATRQLSVGWESQLVSQISNAPGSFAFMRDSFSNRSSVLSGVKNRHFGSTSGEIDGLLGANSLTALLSKIEGATGTAEGMAVTAITGAMPRRQFKPGGGVVDPTRLFDDGSGAQGGGYPSAQGGHGNASGADHRATQAAVAQGVREGMHGMQVVVIVQLPNGTQTTATGRVDTRGGGGRGNNMSYAAIKENLARDGYVPAQRGQV